MSQKLPNPHATLTAKTPHIAMFSFSGAIFAASAILGDLNNVFAQLMAAAPAIGALLHVIYNESQVAKNAYDQGSGATNSQALATAVSALTTLLASGSTDITAIKAFAAAIEKAAKGS